MCRATAAVLLLAALLPANTRSQSVETDSLRAAAIAEELAMNAPGTAAADFSMLMPDGSERRLSDFRGERLLLVLFDPDCDHCMQVVASLAPRVPRGLGVLAVYADGDPALWARAQAAVPDGWMVAFDAGGVYSNGIYSPEFLPGIYLIDAEGMVVSRGEDLFL